VIQLMDMADVQEKPATLTKPAENSLFEDSELA
jgi:hypothetical protein